MEKQAKQRLKSKQLATSKKPEEEPVLSKSVDSKQVVDKATVLSKSVDNKTDIDKTTDQPIEYDYMKYPSNKKKAKLSKCAKVPKNVSFKLMVELVTYTDNWKMKMIEGKLRTEEEQHKSLLKRRNF